MTAAIIEAAARAQMLAEYPGDPNRWETAPEHSRWLYRARTRTVLLAVAEALYAPVLELHTETHGMGWDEAGRYELMPSVCTTCGTSNEYGVPYPCPTVSALRDTLAAIKDGAA